MGVEESVEENVDVDGDSSGQEIVNMSEEWMRSGEGRVGSREHETVLDDVRPAVVSKVRPWSR